jgi:hypothetical protein
MTSLKLFNRITALQPHSSSSGTVSPLSSGHQLIYHDERNTGDAIIKGDKLMGAYDEIMSA